MRNILTEKRQWCKVEIGKKTEKYAQTASESLYPFLKRDILYTKLHCMPQELAAKEIALSQKGKQTKCGKNFLWE